MAHLLESPTRVLFFTGKGGVGKTSIACATAVALADEGKRVLLVSTDPASNLDEVLGVKLRTEPTQVPVVPRLMAMNIDPLQAAQAYKERVVGPYRGVLPASAITSMEEQLSGACTVEIAAFDEFSKLLGDAKATAEFDHVLFDTAPTGHTLRLLELPAAWTSFIESNVGGTSCLGPLAGLGAQRALYAASSAALRDSATTTLVLVVRPDRASIKEAERTRGELVPLGVTNVLLVVNGVFRPADPADTVAQAMARRGREALENLPAGLAALRRHEVPLLDFGLVGIEALRAMFLRDRVAQPAKESAGGLPRLEPFDALVSSIGAAGHGVVMTMGKGGVGKTRRASHLRSPRPGTPSR